MKDPPPPHPTPAAPAPPALSEEAPSFQGCGARDMGPQPPAPGRRQWLLQWSGAWLPPPPLLAWVEGGEGLLPAMVCTPGKHGDPCPPHQCTEWELCAAHCGVLPYCPPPGPPQLTTCNPALQKKAVMQETACCCELCAALVRGPLPVQLQQGWQHRFAWRGCGYYRSHGGGKCRCHSSRHLPAKLCSSLQCQSTEGLEEGSRAGTMSLKLAA